MNNETKDQVLCPRCSSSSVAEILWGEPAFSEHLLTEIELGHISLGGCCVTVNDPTHECNECKFKWGDTTSEFRRA